MTSVRVLLIAAACMGLCCRPATVSTGIALLTSVGIAALRVLRLKWSDVTVAFGVIAVAAVTLYAVSCATPPVSTWLHQQFSL